MYQQLPIQSLQLVSGGCSAQPGLLCGSQHSDQSLNFVYGATAYAAAWNGSGQSRPSIPDLFQL